MSYRSSEAFANCYTRLLTYLLWNRPWSLTEVTVLKVWWTEVRWWRAGGWRHDGERSAGVVVQSRLDGVVVLEAVLAEPQEPVLADQVPRRRRRAQLTRGSAVRRRRRRRACALSTGHLLHQLPRLRRSCVTSKHSLPAPPLVLDVLSVCLSVTCRFCIETAIGSHGDIFHCVSEKLRYLQK